MTENLGNSKKYILTRAKLIKFEMSRAVLASLLTFNFFIFYISRAIILPARFLKSFYNILKREIFSRVIVTFFCFYRKSLRNFVRVFDRRVRFIFNLFQSFWDITKLHNFLVFFKIAGIQIEFSVYDAGFASLNIFSI